jgi:hypothetical protein
MFYIERRKLEVVMQSSCSKQSVKKAYAMTQMETRIPGEGST